MLRNPARLMAAVAFAGLWTATAVNALWLQAGPHPAPLVQQLPWQATEPRPAVVADEAVRPAEPEQALVRDIQTALSERGFYGGPVDGLYGPGTRAAIETYQRIAGEEVGKMPSPALLARIQLSSFKAPPLPPSNPLDDEAGFEETVQAEPATGTAGESDPRIAELQRVLADMGYAPGPIDGRWGTATSAAIGRFEEDRGLPVTGEASEQVLSELSRISGTELR